MGLIILFLAIFSFYYFFRNQKQQVCINSNCFNVEIARTEAERERGLMWRKSLAEDAGMFFIFEKEDFYPFWMKNTLIPLDIIWINVNNEIVYIAKNAPPCPENCKSYIPTEKAKYVLEINGGLSDKFGVKTLDKVSGSAILQLEH